MSTNPTDEQFKEGEHVAADVLLNEIEAQFDEAFKDDGGFTLGERTRVKLIEVIDEGKVDIEDTNYIRVLARFWTRGEELYEEKAVFDFLDYPDDSSFVETPNKNGTPFELLEQWARERIDNYDSVIEQTVDFIKASHFRKLLKDHSIDIEVNHGTDDTPGVIMGILAIAYNRAYPGEDIGGDMNLLLGPRVLLSHETELADPNDPESEDISMKPAGMIGTIGNYVMIFPPTKNAKVPGADRFVRKAQIAGIRKWRELEQTPGQINIVNRAGSSDSSTGEMGAEPSSSVIASAAPTENKVTIPIALFTPEGSSRVGIAFGDVHKYDPRHDPESLGRIILYRELYGDLLADATSNWFSDLPTKS